MTMKSFLSRIAVAQIRVPGKASSSIAGRFKSTGPAVTLVRAIGRHAAWATMIVRSLVCSAAPPLTERLPAVEG